MSWQLRGHRAVAVVVASVLVLTGLALAATQQPAAATNELDDFFSVTVPGAPEFDPPNQVDIPYTSLPTTVRLSLNGIPEPRMRPYDRHRFAVQLPMTVSEDATFTRATGSPNTASSTADLDVPAGVPCGRYPAVALVPGRAGSDEVNWTAQGSVNVVGCPREFDVTPVVTVIAQPGQLVPLQFAGRYFPNRSSRVVPRSIPAIDITVDGVVRASAPTLPGSEDRTTFDLRASLVLACGQHEVRAVPRGLVEAVPTSRTIEVRCPTILLDRDQVERKTPGVLQGQIAELAGSRPFSVLLDGVPVTPTSLLSDKDGTGAATIPIPPQPECGVHYVDVVQDQPPPDITPVTPFPPPGAEPPYATQPEPVIRLRGRPGYGPRPAAPPTARVVAPSSDPDVVARATFTVVCPGVPLLSVTPDLAVDNGQQRTYTFTLTGFPDNAPVVFEDGSGVVPVGTTTTDGFGELTGAALLRPACGPTTFTARVLPSEEEPSAPPPSSFPGASPPPPVPVDDEIAQDTVEVRCPALVLDPDVVGKLSLPRPVPGKVTGFGSAATLDVLLDGADVGDRVSDGLGRADVVVPAASGLTCGPHVVVVRQRGPLPRPQAQATLLVVKCPQDKPTGDDPVIEVAPEVVGQGFTARVTATGLPPGPVLLHWTFVGAPPRPALGSFTRTTTVAPDGTLDLSLLLLRGEQLGQRRIGAFTPLSGTLLALDLETTLVVQSSFQPGRRSQVGRNGLLGRR